MERDEYDSLLSDFRSYLQLERSLSPNTVSAYSADAEALLHYLKDEGVTSVSLVTGPQLATYIESMSASGLSKRSQARAISSIKSLFRFLEDEGQVKENPCDMIEDRKSVV